MKKYCCINIFVFSRILFLHRNNKAKIQVTQNWTSLQLEMEKWSWQNQRLSTAFSGMSVHGPHSYQKLPKTSAQAKFLNCFKLTLCYQDFEFWGVSGFFVKLVSSTWNIKHSVTVVTMQHSLPPALYFPHWNQKAIKNWSGTLTCVWCPSRGRKKTFNP